MKTIVAMVLAMGALTALGCDDKKTDAKPEAKPAATAAPAHTATAAPAKSAAPGGGW